MKLNFMKMLSFLHREEDDERGATALEWTLLVGAIGLPMYWIMMTALNLLLAHYRMMTMMNSLPFP